MSSLDIRVGGLDDAPVRALLAAHLTGMHASSPHESVHALDADALRDPSVTFWSAWRGGKLAGIGALKDLGGSAGEIKSMRVGDGFLGSGVGRALLRHIVAVARDRGMRSLWLETGSPGDFLPARRLYESEGFVNCGPFAGYQGDPFSVFMTREL